jgi:hypothetical protein
MADFKPHPVFPMTGQMTLGASGSVSQFPTLDAHRVTLVAHPSNNGVVWVGQQSGTVNGETGFPLEASGEHLYLEGLVAMGALYASPDVASDKLCWVLLDETPQYQTRD